MTDSTCATTNTTGCAAFCDLPARDGGDDLHGDWCVSPPVGREVSVVIADAPSELTIDRVARGVSAAPFIRLTTLSVDGHEVELRLTSGNARSLGAALQRACQLVEELA